MDAIDHRRLVLWENIKQKAQCWGIYITMFPKMLFLMTLVFPSMLGSSPGGQGSSGGQCYRTAHLPGVQISQQISWMDTLLCRDMVSPHTIRIYSVSLLIQAWWPWQGPLLSKSGIRRLWLGKAPPAPLLIPNQWREGTRNMQARPVPIGRELAGTSAYCKVGNAAWGPSAWVLLAPTTFWGNPQCQARLHSPIPSEYMQATFLEDCPSHFGPSSQPGNIISDYKCGFR